MCDVVSVFGMFDALFVRVVFEVFTMCIMSYAYIVVNACGVGIKYRVVCMWYTYDEVHARIILGMSSAVGVVDVFDMVCVVYAFDMCDVFGMIWVSNAFDT